MVDLQQGRNFALNPGEGLKISPFKNAHSLAATQDRELERLADYLVRISTVADFQTLDHRVSITSQRLEAERLNNDLPLEMEEELKLAILSHSRISFSILVMYSQP